MNGKSDRPDKGFLKAVKEFFQGMAIHEPAMAAVREKAAIENLMMIAVFGDFLGIPIFRPYYSLRLLPYVASRLPYWRRHLLKQRDWTDWAFD